MPKLADGFYEMQYAADFPASALAGKTIVILVKEGKCCSLLSLMRLRDRANWISGLTADEAGVKLTPLTKDEAFKRQEELTKATVNRHLVTFKRALAEELPAGS